MNTVEQQTVKTLTITIAPTSSYTLQGGAQSATASNTIIDNTGGFTLDGQAGTISYMIPWASVDDGQVSQSLALTDFILTFAGESITSSRNDVTFAVAPVATFEYGTMTGIAFEIDTTGIAGYAYASLSAQGWTISALNAVTQDESLAPLPDGLVVLDFDYATTGKPGGYKIKLYFEKWNTDGISTVTVNVPEGDASSDVAARAVTAIEDTGLFIASRDGTKVTIKPKEAVGKNWASLNYLTFSGPGVGTWDPNLSGAKVLKSTAIKVRGQAKP